MGFGCVVATFVFDLDKLVVVDMSLLFALGRGLVYCCVIWVF